MVALILRSLILSLRRSLRWESLPCTSQCLGTTASCSRLALTRGQTLLLGPRYAAVHAAVSVPSWSYLTASCRACLHCTWPLMSASKPLSSHSWSAAPSLTQQTRYVRLAVGLASRPSASVAHYMHGMVYRRGSVRTAQIGCTALHHAAEAGYAGVVQQLLKRGAQCSARDKVRWRLRWGLLPAASLAPSLC